MPSALPISIVMSNVSIYHPYAQLSHVAYAYILHTLHGGDHLVIETNVEIQLDDKTVVLALPFSASHEQI